MITSPILSLHMPDGLIEGHWLALGWVCAGLLAWFGTRRLADSDIPKIALLCAVFFITSIIPIQIPGGPRAHLLLNGLIGVILGRQCVLAFAPALFLQAVLFSHGGFLTLGLNLCVMSLPALLSRQLFVGLLWFGDTFPRWSLFLAEMLAHFATLMVLSCVAGSLYISFQKQDFYLTPEGFFSPLNNAFVIPICMVVSGIIAYATRQATKDSIFSAGFFAGEITVLVSLAANCLVMFLCGVPDLASVFLITLLVHLPLAIVEGLITGSVIQFIHKVKPELMPLSSTSDQKTSSIPDTLES